jgi:hypothetical protein
MKGLLLYFFGTCLYLGPYVILFCIKKPDHQSKVGNKGMIKSHLCKQLT